MILKTQRLIMRAWTMEDAEDLYRYASDPDIGPLAGWPPHKDVEESREIIRKIFLPDTEQYALCLKADVRPIGAIGLKRAHQSRLAQGLQECELGFWIGRPYWGQGLMPEAARELLRHAFDDLRMEKVFYAYYDGNTRSQRVQEKLGFRYQRTIENVEVPLLHTLRTSHVNLLTREDWRQKNAQ